MTAEIVTSLNDPKNAFSGIRIELADEFARTLTRKQYYEARSYCRECMRTLRHQVTTFVTPKPINIVVVQ